MRENEHTTRTNTMYEIYLTFNCQNQDVLELLGGSSLKFKISIQDKEEKNHYL